MTTALHRALIPALVCLNVVAPLIGIAIMLRLVDRGFDITDESFYILNAWYPADNIGALSAFGHYLNLIEPIIGRDVAALRVVGLTTSILCGSIVAWQLGQYCRVRLQEELSRGEHIVLVFAVSAAVLSHYVFWVLTPSYRLFSLAGAALVASGGIRALRTFSVEPLATDRTVPGFISIALLVGIGGFAGFIGRPTTALALGFAISAWLAFVAPVRYWLSICVTAGAIFILLLVSYVWAFEDGVTAFVGRIVLARELIASIELGHTVSNAFERAIRDLLGIPLRALDAPLVAGFAVMATAFVFSLATGTPARNHASTSWRATWSASLGVGLAVVASVWVARAMPKHVAISLGDIGLELVLALALPLILMSVADRVVCRGDRASGQSKGFVQMSSVRTEVLLLVLLLVAVALATSFGSASSLINGSREAFFLYIAAVVVMLLALIPQRLRVVRMLVLSLVGGSTLLILLWAAANPFRLAQDIRRQTEEVAFLGSSTVLKVDRATALWVEGLVAAARENGWEAGNYLIDLTGASPGAAVVLAGRTPTTPWLAGGFAGSENFVRRALSMAPQDVLESAWVLTAPAGQLRVPERVLETVGLSFPDDYTVVGSVITAHRFRLKHRNERQFLWKPKHQLSALGK